ncbi:hypothetical protein BLJAPNOD_05582 [Ensifer sp. M14]|nr:hypothetical protein BLJAPNOD_05582 [Ensifer sp. M14]
MAIGKFHGVMMPTTPTGSRVISTPMFGRTEGMTSPAKRSASPAKKSKIWPARTVSPMPSASVLPSSRDNSRPSSSLRAKISSAVFRRMAWRSRMPERDQAGKAALAAAIAAFASSTEARAYSPITSLVSDGLILRTPSPPTHSPAIRFWCNVIMGFLDQLACGEVPHEMGCAERPWNTLR